MTLPKKLLAFEPNMLPGETFLDYLSGHVPHKIGGQDTLKGGHLILTNRRLVFWGTGFFSDRLDTMPLDKISSVETKKGLIRKVIRAHSSNDDMEFTTGQSSEEVDRFVKTLEQHRQAERATAAPTAAPSSDVTTRLLKLAEMHSAGLLTAPEFDTAKRAVLAGL